MALGCGKEKNKNLTSPYAPEDALSTLKVAEGFRIELVAAEPLIADPVAMEIDEAGRIYVVEMHGYPLDKGGSGKIKLLSDTNGDGKLDKSTVFAEGLTLPNGIMRWKKGVIVTDAPDLLYLEDQNNDGVSDIKQVLLTGFALSNPQHNLNTPVYGLDNWIYLAHESAVTAKVYQKEFGDEGKAIIFPGRAHIPALPVNAAGRNVRFRPDTYELELMSAESQFGQTFDTWGHQFLVSNAHHLYQEVLPARYISRNPDLLLSDATQSIPDHGDAAEVFPITTNPEHQLLTDVGVMTSACGITSYLGNAFPEDFHEAIFVAEPVHNIVHVDKLIPKGASFTGSRMYAGKEFLASTDSWFRPVNFYIGPDGAMYVIDYYRQIIEHPEWMADEVNQSGALYNGTDKGRIYRIVPVNFSANTGQNSLANASIEELVKALEHKNSWWRKNAQRILVDKKDPSSVLPLAKMVRESTSGPGRLHALWTLEGIQKLDTTLIIKALKDPVAGVRENAIKLAELHLKNQPSLVQPLLALSKDSDAKVRYQLLCTLGGVSGEKADKVRQQILFADMDDEWFQVAALSSPAINPVALLEQTRQKLSMKESKGNLNFIRRVSAMIGNSNQADEVSKLLKTVSSAANTKSNGWWCAASLEGLAQGMRGKSHHEQTLPTERELLINNFYIYPSEIRQSSLKVLQILGLPEGSARQKILKRALATTLNKQADVSLRSDAIGLLSLGEVDRYSPELKNLISPKEPAEIQLVTIQALSQTKGSEISKFILEKWSTLTPEIRERCIDLFMEEPVRMNQLLNAIEHGIVQGSTVGWQRSVELMNHEDLSIRNQARSLLDEKPGLREEVAKQYQVALTLTGNADKGKAVFNQICATCHQMGNTEGKAFGPDLTSLKNRKPEAIMKDILMPNRSIADGYEWWEVKDKSGKVYTGIIASETTGTITLRNMAGPEITISRNMIDSLKASDVSAMPSGLEKLINEQQMADLLAYIKQTRID